MAGQPETAPRARDQDYLLLLGTRIRRLRSERRMSRRQLSLQSGVSERFIAQLELGQGNISILRLRDITEALSVSMVDIVGEVGVASDDPATTIPPPVAIAELIREADPSFQKAVMELVRSEARRRNAA